MRVETVAEANVAARFEGKDLKTTRTNGKGEFTITGLDPGFTMSFSTKPKAIRSESNMALRSKRIRPSISAKG